MSYSYFVHEDDLERPIFVLLCASIHSTDSKPPLNFSYYGFVAFQISTSVFIYGTRNVPPSFAVESLTGVSITCTRPFVDFLRSGDLEFFTSALHSTLLPFLLRDDITKAVSLSLIVQRHTLCLLTPNPLLHPLV